MEFSGVINDWILIILIIIKMNMGMEWILFFFIIFCIYDKLKMKVNGLINV